MRFNRLDLNLLVALDALLEQCNVTRAAEQVHLTQSAMSNALSRLRQHFDDELLVPIGRRLELTPRGQALRGRVRDLLVQVESVLEVQASFDPATSQREFTLLASDYSLATLVVPMLAEAERQGSTARLTVLPLVSEPGRSLERAEVDLLLIPETYCAAEHPREVLLHDELVCVVWRDSAIGREGAMDLARYVAAGHVALHAGNGATPYYEQWLAERCGAGRRIEVRCYSIALLPHLVVGNERVVTVHRRLAERLQPALPVLLLPLPVQVPPLDVAMQWHRHRAQDPGVAWLRDLARQAAAQQDAHAPVRP